MKILMVITGMRSGGAERVMATLCNALSKTNEVRLFILKDSSSDYKLEERVEIVAGNVKNQSVFQSVNVLKKQFVEWNPDVILSFMTKTNLVVLLAKILQRSNKPVVIAERANPYNAKLPYKILRRILYPKANGCVFQTKQAQDYYENIVKCDSVVIRNPLNSDFSTEPYNGIVEKKIVSVGRLSVEKNHKLLIDAFSRVAQHYREYTLEIYGDGPLREKLEMQIRELRLENRVFLMGRKENIQKHICSAEVFVLPSNSEGMPNALLEAMALGLACIATDCPIGGSAVIIENEKNGLLIPVNDEDALVEAMERMMNDAVYRNLLRSEARKVVELFEEGKICKEWDEYLKKVYDTV